MAASEAEDVAPEGEYVQEIAYIVPDGEVETTCKICHAEFLDGEDLNVHVKQVHEGFPCPKTCQFCVATYTDLDDYAGHIRDDHLLHLKSCRYCTKCFTDQRKVKKHEKLHLGHKSGMYACSQCVGLFTTQKELELHEVINHNNKYDGEILKCMPYLSCLLKLNAVALLQIDTVKVLICHACEFTSVDLSAYLQHLKDEKCVVYICDTCGNILKNRSSLIKHLQRKNKCLDPKTYASDLTTCPTCKNEIHSTQMQTHLKFCTAYICNICNIQFETIEQLSFHQSDVHPSELDVTRCKYCPREYVGSDALEKHIDRSHRHTFIHFKYACRSCGAIFKHPRRLFAHYFLKHKELHPYTCRICNMTFRIRKRFTIHIKLVHKGVGVVEFDDQYHVFFTEKISENPFVPTCVVPELLPDENIAKKVIVKKGNTIKSNVLKKLNLNSGKSDAEETETAKLRLVSVTKNETDDNTETMKTPTSTKQEKKKRKRSKKDIVHLSSSDEESEPLLNIKKRAERKRSQKFVSSKKKYKDNTPKRPFTCNVCHKYCYTYQNYHNHLKTHSKNESIECVKCSKSFRTKKEWTQHVSVDHATSKLIETLKSVLERKQGEQNTQKPDNTVIKYVEPMSERFSKTIKRVKYDKASTQATISPAPNNSSVKKFIENFMPDIGDSTPKEMPQSDPIVTIKHFHSPFYRKKAIEMTKFTPEPPIEDVKLKMPVKFSEQPHERINLTVKLVQQPLKQSMFESYEKVLTYNTDNSRDYDDYEDYKSDAIPDVAQEVMLEGSEEPVKPKGQAPRKIIFPKLPQGYSTIHIATLQPQAPFYKIIKIKGNPDEPIIINNGMEKEEESAPEPVADTDEVISLPDGSKFIPVNPLSHLIDKSLENVLDPKKKGSKPSRANFKGLLVDALQNLDKPNKKRKKMKKKSEI